MSIIIFYFFKQSKSTNYRNDIKTASLQQHDDYKMKEKVSDLKEKPYRHIQCGCVLSNLSSDWAGLKWPPVSCSNPSVSGLFRLDLNSAVALGSCTIPTEQLLLFLAMLSHLLRAHRLRFMDRCEMKQGNVCVCEREREREKGGRVEMERVSAFLTRP